MYLGHSGKGCLYLGQLGKDRFLQCIHKNNDFAEREATNTPEHSVFGVFIFGNFLRKRRTLSVGVFSPGSFCKTPEHSVFGVVSFFLLGVGRWWSVEKVKRIVQSGGVGSVR